MERMEQKHAGDEVVLKRRRQHPFTVCGLQTPIDQPLQSSTMQLNYGLNQLQRSGPNLRVTALVKFGRQLFYLFTLAAELAAPRSGYRLLSFGRHYSGPAAPNI